MWDETRPRVNFPFFFFFSRLSGRPSAPSGNGCPFSTISWWVSLLSGNPGAAPRVRPTLTPAPGGETEAYTEEPACPVRDAQGSGLQAACCTGCPWALVDGVMVGAVGPGLPGCQPVVSAPPGVPRACSEAASSGQGSSARGRLYRTVLDVEAHDAAAVLPQRGLGASPSLLSSTGAVRKTHVLRLPHACAFTLSWSLGLLCGSRWSLSLVDGASVQVSCCVWGRQPWEGACAWCSPGGTVAGQPGLGGGAWGMGVLGGPWGARWWHSGL